MMLLDIFVQNSDNEIYRATKYLWSIFLHWISAGPSIAMSTYDSETGE